MEAERSAPVLCKPDQLLTGWEEALRMMRPGDKWKLHIPPALAFGAEKAADGLVRPYDVLVVELELLWAESGAKKSKV